MGLGSYLSNQLFGDDQRKRAQQADTLAEQLMSKGNLEPDTINDVVNNWVTTGQIKIPDIQAKPLPYDPDVPEGRSTPETVQFSKKKGLFGFNSQTGKFTPEETPDGMTDFEVKSYTPAKQPGETDGHAYKIDDATGTTQDLGPNHSNKDTYVHWDSTKGKPRPTTPGAGKDTPDVVLAKQTMKRYQDMISKGDDVPDDFMDSVRSAADKLNINMTEVQKDPGILDSLQSAASTVTGGAVPAPKPVFKGTSPRFTPKAGKPLSRALAQQYLQKAGGDKDKARALAAKDGYTF